MTHSKQIRVLVVVDAEEVSEQICSMLRKSDFTVERTKDGPEGLALLKRVPVDVMVPMVRLPGMNGIQLAQAARRIHPQLQVTMAVPDDDQACLGAAVAAGIASYIRWPCQAVELCAVVRSAVYTLRSNTRRLVEDRSGVLYKLVTAFAAAVDAKSYYTFRHSARVTEICVKLSKAMGLSDDEAAMLEIAALVHDIGKIGTPDLILAKPDVLSDEEWVDVLKHPDVGSSILAQVGELAEVAAIVRHHHERMDGTGYPDGLVGEAIPHLARTLMVVDAYEAMTSERPYRRAFTHEEALNELTKGRGMQFDPHMVDAFVRAVSELEGELQRAA